MGKTIRWTGQVPWTRRHGFFGESRAQSTEEPVFIQPINRKKYRSMHQSPSNEVGYSLDKHQWLYRCNCITYKKEL